MHLLFQALNLPRLLPSQTLYSWCGAVHAWNGNADSRETSRQLFGAPYAAMQHDFPSRLTTLAERTHHQLEDPATLALQRTLLGYFLPAASQSLASSVLEAVHSGSLAHVKMNLGIPASRVGAHHPLKGCPACFDEDEQSHGHAFWHVGQQYPSVLVCTKHRQPLRIAWDPTTPVHRRGWLLPRQGLARQWSDIRVRTSAQMTNLSRLAEFSEAWAELPPAALNAIDLARCYQDAMRRRGIVTAGGNLRLPLLIEAVRSTYEGLEVLPGLHVLTSVNPQWPGLAAALSRKRPRPGHPLKHLLLISMLFDRWGDFLVGYREATTSASMPEPTFDQQQADLRPERLKALVQEEGLSVTASARALGVSVATGIRWAKVQGIAFTPRPKSLHFAVLTRARTLLVAGHDKIDVQQRVGISAVSLNRLLSSEPQIASAWRAARIEVARADNRSRFLAVVASHSGWPIKAIRSIPGNGYMWLYRNDRQWLAEHMPAMW